jgi:predicted 3-demethylubiquinone-9 3-methyltransferase (glyoxalase superfamily)
LYEEDKSFLWFDSEAEQAAKFYVGIFKNSRIGKIARYPKEAAAKIGRPPGSVMTAEFTLDRVEFVALNGGPSSSSPKRSRSRSTATPRMRSIISGTSSSNNDARASCQFETATENAV